MLILAAQYLIFVLGWPKGRSGGDGCHQLKISGVRAHTSIWAHGGDGQCPGAAHPSALLEGSPGIIALVF